jgi:hypothetical protein
MKCGLITELDEYFQSRPKSLVPGLKMRSGFNIMICRWKESSLQIGSRNYRIEIILFVHDGFNVPLTICPGSISEETTMYNNIDTPLRR